MPIDNSVQNPASPPLNMEVDNQEDPIADIEHAEVAIDIEGRNPAPSNGGMEADCYEESAADIDDAESANDNAAEKAASEISRDEGRKKGKRLASLCEIEGFKFYNVCVDTARGRHDLLRKVLEGIIYLQFIEDESCARQVEVVLLHAFDEGLLILCHVPQSLSFEIDQVRWMKAICGELGCQEGMCQAGIIISTAYRGKKGSPEYMRKLAEKASHDFLRRKNLVPKRGGDDEDYGQKLAAAVGLEF